ncbi:MAG TPA: hypothetical protein VGB17_00575 [Pyrinomonadaceae bacterium]|jgi:uncharacterized SAM-binding protein YcdF (DUF218 family)
MTAINNRKFLMLAVIAFAAPFLSVTLIVGARAAALTHGAQDELLLLALALGGAAASILNGFGRRTGRTLRVAPRGDKMHEHAGPHSSVVNVNC